MSSTISKKETSSQQEPSSRDGLQQLGFPSLRRMRQEMEDLWGKFFNEVPALWNAERSDARWAFDVVDQPDAYLIKAEAPGFDAKDFMIDLRGDQLVMQAKKSEQKKDKGQETFSATEFYHAMTLPPCVESDKISATYKQGVLEVCLPKDEKAKGRRIPVNG